MAPSTMKAYVIGHRSLLSRAYNGITTRKIGHGGALSTSVPVPPLQPDRILIKVHAVAQNPTDWKHIDIIGRPASIVGCDFSGVVVEIGSEAQSDEKGLKVGDRVAGVVHGGFYTDEGSYAEYLQTEPWGVWRVPDSISHAEASTYGSSAVTGMQTLYHILGLPWPDDEQGRANALKEKRTVFIYGGSSASGLASLQLAKLAGWNTVATASPHSFEVCKKYGADAVFDYHSIDTASEINKTYPDIAHGMDCIGEGGSVEYIQAVFKGRSARVITLKPSKPRVQEGVQWSALVAYTLRGKEFQWFAPFGPKFPASPQDAAALKRFYDLLPNYLKEIKPLPIEVSKGWDQLEVGMNKLRAQSVSGKKLVVVLVEES